MHADHAPEPAPAPSASGPAGIVTVIARGFGVLVAVALVALLVYGVVKQAPNTTIDDTLAQRRAAPAPGYRLAVLRRGDLGPRLQPALAPALRDGWLSPKELRGTPYVLNIWASWCVPCREEAPRLQREWRRARPQGVLFLGLDMQDASEDARAFMDNFGVDYLNIRDPTKDTARSYGATGIPETYFISARGSIVGHVVGVVSTAQLRSGIAAAMKGQVQAARAGGAQRPPR